ncbi:MAG: hypothetical protein EXS10_03210 [Phycisphaerales bacterium]|nr:hypothetical protein [Phycisphaerales bacterium]
MSDTPLQPFRASFALLGWLLPGLGQWATGARLRGVFAGIGVLGLLFSGLLVGGVDCVDRNEDPLWFIGQVCAGPLVIAADVANTQLLKSGRAAPLIAAAVPYGAAMNPADVPKISSFKGLAHSNEFGTLLVFLAGLMNLVVLLDASIRPSNRLTRRTADAGTRA